MVFQSELITFITDKFSTNTTLSVEYGESAVIEYEDNSLDSVHATITDGVLSIKDNQIKVSSVLDIGDGNGQNINANLTKVDNYSINKTGYQVIAKTSSKIVNIQETYIPIVEN